jgi:hypothetical protein
MKTGNDFYNYQLDEIKKLYKKLQNRVEEKITLNDAVIAWFANGYAEKFREEYLNQHQVAVQ